MLLLKLFARGILAVQGLKVLLEVKMRRLTWGWSSVKKTSRIGRSCWHCTLLGACQMRGQIRIGKGFFSAGLNVKCRFQEVQSLSMNKGLVLGLEKSLATNFELPKESTIFISERQSRVCPPIEPCVWHVDSTSGKKSAWRALRALLYRPPNAKKPVCGLSLPLYRWGVWLRPTRAST